MKSLKLIGICLFMLLGVSNTFAQEKTNIFKRYFNYLLHDTLDVSKPKLVAYPTVAYSPETSWEFGISSLYVFYANRDTKNRLSEINGLTFYTLENQYGFWFEHALYSDQNEWFFLGELKFQSFPLLYYGIGPDAPPEVLALVDANQIQVKERVLRRLVGNLYLGAEIDFARLSSVEFEPEKDTPFQLPTGSEGSTNLGLGAGLIYDNRDNVLNVREGFFSELAFLQYDDLWWSDYTFTSFQSDTRFYKSLNERDVLAGQLVGQFNTGTIPFNQLALLGGENIMRGYYTGRYRDNNLVATQIEYRMLPLPLSFTKRLGLAFFLSTGTVFDEFKNFQFNDLVVSGGGGLRYLLFPKKDIYTRLDVAFTKEGPGFYILIGEAF